MENENQNQTESAEKLVQEFPLLGELMESEDAASTQEGAAAVTETSSASHAADSFSTGKTKGEEMKKLRGELETARQRVQQLERERWLLSQGVPEDDLDYIAFKVGALVTPEKDFAAAAKEYLKNHRGLHAGGISTGIGLGGRLSSKAPGVNETMNRLIRGE